VALLQFLLRRETFTEQYHISFPALVAIYVVACAVAGIVVGLLLPITKWKWGSMVVGVMAILPIGAIIQHTTLRGRPWETANTVVLIIGAIAIGVPVGRIYSVLFQEQLRRGS
jgi:predicted membrane channel-forming protein YqfA (hemolysin III family)